MVSGVSQSVLDSIAGVGGTRKNQLTGPDKGEGVFSWELEIKKKAEKAAQTPSDGVFLLMYRYISIRQPGARSQGQSPDSALHVESCMEL